MSGWYNKVKSDLVNVVDAISYFENELKSTKSETAIDGHLEMNSREIAGLVAYRFGQLQEIEAILEYLNIEKRKILRGHHRKYLEAYNKDLSSRDAERFAEGEQDYIDMEHLVNEFALVRNKYLALMKGLDTKQYQIGHVVKLRTAGMEDVHLK